MNLKYKKLKGCAVIIAFLMVWEGASRIGLLNPLFVPAFSDVIRAMNELFIKGNLWLHTLLSLGRALAGFIIAAIIAIPLGLVMSGMSRNFQRAFEPVIEVFSQVNPFMLYHLILLFLGIGEATKITIIAWTCIWPMLFSTITGVLNVNPIYIKNAKVFRLNKWQMAVKILLPGAMPQILYGVRMSAGYSLFMLIAAEMMGGSSGLGFLIMLSQRDYRIDCVFAAVVMITVLGVLMDMVLNPIENKLLHLWEENDG